MLKKAFIASYYIFARIINLNLRHISLVLTYILLAYTGIHSLSVRTYDYVYMIMLYVDVEFTLKQQPENIKILTTLHVQ